MEKAKLRKKIPTCKNKLVCPRTACDNRDPSNFTIVEMIPSVRDIHGIVAGKIIISTESSEFHDGDGAIQVCCEECGHEWPLGDRDSDYMDWSDWQQVKPDGEQEAV